MSDALIAQVVEHLEALPPNLQKQVLELVRALDASHQQGVQGRRLSKFAGTIAESDLHLMSRAIEQGCERVDLDEW